MEEYIGIIKLFAGNYEPQYYMYCDGRLLPISQYSVLFAILGTTYGGDGQTTFALPDLRGRAPIGMGQGPGLQPYTQGQAGGSENVTLLATQMPAHTHLLQATTGAGDAAAPTGALLAAPTATDETSGGAVAVKPYLNGAADTTLNPASVGGAGGSQPHANMQPYLALNYIICVEGIFPPRN